MFLRLLIFATLLVSEAFGASTAPTLHDPVTWEDLKRVIEQNDFRTRDELLAALPPKFRASMKVVFASKSTAVTGVTSKTPRLVFGGDRNGFTLTMSTVSEGPDAGFIEIASPTGDHRVAEPKVIELGAQKNRRSVFIEDPYKAFAGHPNKDCRLCHSERFRYLWPGVYPAWPGVIGEQHNRAISKTEVAALADLKNNPVIGKYLDPKFGLSEFGDNNQRFNEMIANSHAKRISHDLRIAKGIEEYRTLLASIPRSRELVGTSYRLTENLDDVLMKLTSPEFLAMIPERKRDDFRRTIGGRLQRVLEKSYAYNKSVILSDGSSRASVSEVMRVLGSDVIPVGKTELQYALIQYIADDLGIPTRDWSWTLDQRAVNLNDGQRGLWGTVDWRSFANTEAPEVLVRPPAIAASAAGEQCAIEFGKLTTLTKSLVEK